MRTDSHSFSPRAPRVSSGPRSRKSTAPPRGVAQVGAVERERALQRARLAHEHAADLVGLEQPLVRVEHERVGQPEAVERAAPARSARRARRRRRRRAATGRAPRRRRAARAAGRPRRCSSCRRSRRRRTAPAGGAVVFDGARAARPRRAGRRVGGQHARARRRAARSRARQRRVRLVGDVGDRAGAARPPSRAARAAAKPVEVRDRAAGGEHALVPSGIPHQSRSQSSTTSSTAAGPSRRSTSR